MRSANKIRSLVVAFVCIGALGSQVFAGDTEVRLKKRVSLDGVTFFDADDPATGPTGQLGADATYHLVVINPSPEPLTNIFLSDPTLGLVNVPMPGGPLASGFSRTMTPRRTGFSLLQVDDLCDEAGTFVNIATVTAQGETTGTPVSDDDPAHVNCISDPDIKIRKEVSLDAGVTFFDANTPATGPTGQFGADANYRLIVTNSGTETLINALITDATLGLVDVPVPGGPLAPGEMRTITSADFGFSLLQFDGRCDDVGTFVNIATVDAVGDTTGMPVSDDDPAYVNCISNPDIKIRKEVSLDGGVTFFDANTPATGPTGPLGADALYRLTVTNTGNEPLVNVIVNDGTLGIVDFVVGSLAFAETVVLTQGEIPELFVVDRCDSVGNFLNIAVVNADGAFSGTPVEDDDPANVNCENPRIELLKQVSLTGSDPFFDADDAGDPDVPTGTVSFGADATYRLIVRNIGTEVLINPVINDPTLGLVDVPVPGGSLLVGEERTIVSGDAGFENLDFPGRCDTAGVKFNIASVNAEGQDSGTPVGDDNPANVKCIEGPAIELLKQVSLTGGEPFFDADDAGTGPTGIVSLADATYRLIVRNVGDEVLIDGIVNDATLGLLNVAVPGGPLAPGEERVIDAGDFGFGNLFFPDRCDAVGVKLNIATVDATGEISGLPVDDTNPANVNCSPQACEIAVDKTCSVAQAPTDDLLCEAAISATTLRYIGPDRSNVTVVFEGDKDGVATYGNVDLISGVTILTQASQNGFTIDSQAAGGDGLGSKTRIFFDGVLEEIIHTSCSAIYAAEQPAPLDGGTPNPPDSSKGDPSPNWFVVNFEDKEGAFVEDLAPQAGADVCQVVAGDGVECTKRPTEIDIRYTGSACAMPLENPQEDKASCVGDPGGAEPVRILFTDRDGDEVYFDSGTANVNVGDVVTGTSANAGENDFASDSRIQIIDGNGNLLQEVQFHSSCSKPLRIGDDFGGVEIVGFVNEEQGVVQLGVNVEYAYQITNVGATNVDLTSVLDHPLGELLVPSPQFLGVGEMLTLQTTAFIDSDTTNIVSVTGNVAGDSAAQCVASDTTTVHIVPPPSAPFDCSDAKPFTSLSLIWDGPDGIDVTTETGQLFEGVQNGNELTFSLADAGGDFELTISPAVDGNTRSTFHLSCSDQDMNGPEDCGKLQGDGKKGESDKVNRWLLQGLTGSLSFACGLPSTGVLQPSAGGPQVFGAAALDLGDDKKVKWELTNPGNEDRFITRVVVTWPTQHGQVKKFKLEGDFAKDVFDPTSPTAVPDEKAFESDANKRKLKKGDTKKLEIEFSDSFSSHTEGQFTISVEFDNGETVTFP